MRFVWKMYFSHCFANAERKQVSSLFLKEKQEFVLQGIGLVFIDASFLLHICVHIAVF